MTYDPLIPAANEIISVSQPKILENFTQLNTIFGIDHVEYNNLIAANRGKHTKVTYVQQSGDPATGPTVTEIQIYTKDVAGTPRIFVRRLGVGNIYQLDGGPTPVSATTGSTWIPGGIILKWGQFKPAAASGTLDYVANGNTVFPTTTFRVFLNQINGTNQTNPVASGGAAADFTFSNLDPARTYSYLAIGN
jgi:hypothetical protein